MLTYSQWSGYSVPAITRGDFSYSSSGFRVKIQGEHNGIERCSAQRLHTLLTRVPPTPVLTKAGKVAKFQPFPCTDESDAFYTGQLIHYGLPQAATKDASKRRLLAAFGSQTTLMVPAHIIAIERELKEQYDELHAEARAKNKEMKRLESMELEKKRKAAEEEKRKQLAKDQAEMNRFLKDSERALTKLTKKELCSKISRLPAPTLRQLVIGWVDEVPGFADAARKKVDPACVEKPKKPKDPYTGTYRVIAPSLKKGSSERPMWFKMALSSTSSHIWGAFSFGDFRGVVRSHGHLGLSGEGGAVKFQWRGREGGENTIILCGEDNTGTLTFSKDGRFKGSVFGPEGDFEFAGRREVDLGLLDWSEMVRAWKHKWRGYNHEVNAIEFKRRGKGRGNLLREGRLLEDPAVSDTTDGEFWSSVGSHYRPRYDKDESSGGSEDEGNRVDFEDDFKMF